MATAITMKDTMLTETVDDDYDDVLAALNGASNKGVNFLTLDGLDGERCAFNIMNIMVIKELDDE